MAKTKIAELEDGFKTAAIAVGTALGNLAHKVGIGTAPKAKKKAAVKKAPASKEKAAPKKKVIAKKVASKKAAPKRTSPKKAKSSAKKK